MNLAIFLVNIGPKLANEIPNVNSDFTEYLGSKSANSIFLKPVTENEVKGHLQTLDTRKACGYDNLPTRLLKDAASYISGPLSYIFNLSIEKGKFPDALKVAKVTPIYKKGQKDLAGNYRPISVSPVLGKIFEKIINNRVIDYFRNK